MEKKLRTRKQILVYRYIVSYTVDHGRPPTYREIAEKFKFKSDNAAFEHVRALEKKGWVDIEKGISRGIRVI